MNNIERVKNTPEFKEWESLYNEVDEKSNRQLTSLFQYLLLVSSSVFGILISLHDTAQQSQCIRLAFFASIVLLSLGILFSASVLYALSTIYDDLRKGLLKVIPHVGDDASKNKDDVRGGNRTKDKVLQKFAICSLLLSLISLVVYTALITFNQ